MIRRTVFKKMRVPGDRYHSLSSSMKASAFFLANVPREYSSSACSVFSAKRMSSRTAGSISESGLRMIRSPSRMIRSLSPSGRLDRIEAGITTWPLELIFVMATSILIGKICLTWNNIRIWMRHLSSPSRTVSRSPSSSSSYTSC